MILACWGRGNVWFRYQPVGPGWGMHCTTRYRYVLCCACGLPTRGARRGFTSSLPRTVTRHQSSRYLFSVCSRITPSPERAQLLVPHVDRCATCVTGARRTRGAATPEPATRDVRRAWSESRTADRLSRLSLTPDSTPDKLAPPLPGGASAVERRPRRVAAPAPPPAPTFFM